MNFLELLSLILISFYFIFIVFVSIGFLIKKIEINSASKEIGISVLIPFKDEQTNLPQLIPSLLNQSYQNVEFIFINDHSSDISVEIIESFLKSNPSFKLIHLENFEFGKKKAIEKGVLNSRHDFILTTDADCIFSENWIFSHANQLSNKNPIVAGRVEIEDGKGLWNKFQQLEMLSIQSVSFSFSNLGLPISISGANLSYQKDLFIQSKPYQTNQEILSGDDIYFLQSVKRKGIKLYFLDSNESMVITKRQKFNGFMFQRIRWMKKSSSFLDLTTVFTGLIIFLSSLQFVFLTGYQLFTLESNFLFFISLLLKIILDFLLLFLVTHHWKRKKLLFWFLPVFLMNVFFITIIPIIGWIMPVRWKGRKI